MNDNIYENEELDIEALDESIDTKVKLKLAIVGIGNAGNQIAVRAYNAGYNVFAINSSYKDLQDVIVTDEIPGFIIGNEARGAGKVRELANVLFKENGRELFEPSSKAGSVFTKLVEESDVIFVVSSTAGGTGSGVAPTLISLLKNMYPNKIVIYYGICPKLADSPTAQNNFLNCIQEIADLNIPYMLADLAYYEKATNDYAYNMLGKHMITCINTIAGRYINYSTSGMIDENDMRVIISEPGYLATYMLDNVTIDMIENGSVQSQLVNLIKHSPAVDINRDRKVSQMGVIVNTPDEIADTVKTGSYEELNQYVGTPYGVFENYSINNSSTAQFIIIYSGMNVSQGRIDKARAKIEEKKKDEELLSKKQGIKFTDENNKPLFDEKSKLDMLRSLSPDEEASKKKSALDSFFK